MKSIVRSTFGPEALTDIGGFGGLFAPAWKDYEAPVLVSSVDGVGTKLKVAFMTGVHHTVGADLVHHCANDILVQGAKPLFFLDYIGMGNHDPEVALAVVSGVAEGCRGVGCALIGGETATMPGFYAPGEYDLAGTIVGIVDRPKLVDGSAIRAGDALIGLGSDGLHTNGYALARRLLFEVAGLTPETRVNGWGTTVGEELLKPHRPYVGPIFHLLERVPVRGMAHITGGGFVDNIPRVLPEGLRARVEKGTWPVLPVFASLKAMGDVSEAEMYRVFNMGIGFVVAVPTDRAEETLALLKAQGERAYRIGTVIAGEKGVEIV
jgi:phosphoribosylformylglycinamidine cyclo-ligase